MGVLNVTPDSFSDGGRFYGREEALTQAQRLVDQGADIIDVGGESSRPGSDPVPPEEQIRRIVPVIAGVRAFWEGPISVDTTSRAVAEAGFGAGADWVNDISALRDDPGMAAFVAKRQCVTILMHMQGTPRSMQANPAYGDVVSEVVDFLAERARAAEAKGLARECIVIDPGIGFGKTLAHNLELLRGLPRLISLGYKVLVGASRKSFIGQITGGSVDDRLEGSLAAALWAVWAGAGIVRVHDVAGTRRALAVAAAIAPHTDLPR